MTAFTRLGSAIWDWEPWTNLEPLGRVLWLALYTSGEAKRHVPGLWQGGIPTIADASRLRQDEVVGALDCLLAADVDGRPMIEYDPKTRVLRLCELPDAGEFPSSGKVILSWWTKFRTVPNCAVRDSHVRTLAWILEEGSKHTRGGYTEHHKQAWDQTFGTLAIPAPRRRGVRRLSDFNDTSTHAQPSLFAPRIPELSTGISSEAGYPQNPQPAVDNSPSETKPNEIRVRDRVCDTLSDTVSDTLCDTLRIPDPGSRILDLGEGERGRGGRPALALVPLLTVADVIRELGESYDRQFHDTHQEALTSRVALWASRGLTPGDLRVLGQFNAVFGYRIGARALVAIEDMVTHIQTCRAELDARTQRLALLAEFTGTREGKG